MSDHSQHSHPLVSVIIPAYKQGPMLAAAIESALAQTYSPLEIVVVDDGSPGPQVRDTAAQFGDRIVYVELENGGVAAARNTGIQAARGELIALLDQDDRWLPGKLSAQVAAFMDHPGVGLIHSSYYLIDAEGRRTGEVRLPEGIWSPLPRLLYEVPVSACTTLFPRRVLDEVGGSLDPSLAGADDWDLWLRIAARGYDFCCVGEPLAEYRVHAGMASRSADLMVASSLAVLRKFFSRPDLPESLRREKARALAARHAWAAAVYYGEGNLQEARKHLQEAAAYEPQAASSGRFLQSLVYARSPNPSMETAREAVRFALGALRGAPSSVRRAARANGYLVLALHSGARRRLVPGLLVRAFAANPAIVLSPEIVRGVARPARRILSKARKQA